MPPESLKAGSDLGLVAHNVMEEPTSQLGLGLGCLVAHNVMEEPTSQLGLGLGCLVAHNVMEEPTSRTNRVEMPLKCRYNAVKMGGWNGSWAFLGSHSALQAPSTYRGVGVKLAL
jgi:hypothetical protein